VPIAAIARSLRGMDRKKTRCKPNTQRLPQERDLCLPGLSLDLAFGSAMPTSQSLPTGDTVYVAELDRDGDAKPDFDALFAESTLPALPQTAIQLLAACQKGEPNIAETAQIIEGDVALTAQTLRYLNSSYFGFRRQIASVKHGITLVGLKTIKTFVLWTAAFDSTPDVRTQKCSSENFRRGALRRGVFAKTLLREAGQGCAETAFTVGMLQKIAMPFLLKVMPEQYEKIFPHDLANVAALCRIEQEHFGWSHVDAAVWLFRRWNFPSDIEELTGRLSHIDRVIDSANASPETYAVAASALLPMIDNPEWGDREAFDLLVNRLIGPKETSVVDLLRAADQAFHDLADSLQIAPARHSLADAYAGKASE